MIALQIVSSSSPRFGRLYTYVKKKANFVFIFNKKEIKRLTGIPIHDELDNNIKIYS